MREVSGHWIDEQLIRMFASGPSGTACRQSISPERIKMSREDGSGQVIKNNSPLGTEQP